jgi:hypothetical protein
MSGAKSQLSVELNVESFPLPHRPGLWQSVWVRAVQQKFWPDPQPLVERLGSAFFRRLPENPGVYLMHGPDETILYVGKARNLRHRLSSYRVANPDRVPRRTLRLLRMVTRIAWEECGDEAAALRRESELLLACEACDCLNGYFGHQPEALQKWLLPPAGSCARPLWDEDYASLSLSPGLLPVAGQDPQLL